MDFVTLLAAILTALLLLTLVCQSHLLIVLMQTATAALLSLNRACLNYPLQETQPPLLQEEAVLQAVQEASGTCSAVLNARVVQESLHQRNLPTAMVTGLK